MGITQKINMVPLQVAMGFSQGIMPPYQLQLCQRQNYRRMKETIFFTIKTLLPFLVVVSPGILPGRACFTRAFMDNEAIVAYGTRFLRVLPGTSVPVHGFSGSRGISGSGHGKGSTELCHTRVKSCWRFRPCTC